MIATADRELSESSGALDAGFWRLWTAAAVSNVGDGFALIALPLMAASLTGEPSVVGGVVVAQRIPWLLFGLPSGALADRLNRVRAMAGCDFLRGAIFVALGMAASLGHTTIVMLYAAAFALGAVETLFSAASHAAVPAIVPEGGLDRANGYIYATETAGSELAGPALGGFLFAVSASLPFYSDAVTFFISGVLLLSLRHRTPAPARKRDGASFMSDIRIGVRFLAHEPVLRLVTGIIGCLAVCQAAVMAMLVLYATRTLGLSESAYGVLFAAGAVGSVIGGLVASRARAVLGTATLLTTAGVVSAGAYVVVGVTTSAVVVALAFVAETVAVACGNVATLTLRQTLVPAELRGRVGNACRMCIWGAIPFGALLGGAVASGWGLRAPFVAAGIGQLILVAAVAGRLARRLRSSDRSLVIDLRQPEPVAA